MVSKQIAFRVTGQLPPKKHGELSMWGQTTEVPRLVALRRSAVVAMNGREPLRGPIALKLTVYVGTSNKRWTGDLDNFITGVCDGLMAADLRAKLDKIWSDPDLEDIHPRVAIGFLDDSQITRISAQKVIGKDTDPWYKVQLEEST